MRRPLAAAASLLEICMNCSSARVPHQTVLICKSLHVSMQRTIHTLPGRRARRYSLQGDGVVLPKRGLSNAPAPPLHRCSVAAHRAQREPRRRRPPRDAPRAPRRRSARGPRTPRRRSPRLPPGRLRDGKQRLSTLFDSYYISSNYDNSAANMLFFWKFCLDAKRSSCFIYQSHYSTTAL